MPEKFENNETNTLSGKHSVKSEFNEDVYYCRTMPDVNLDTSERRIFYIDVGDWPKAQDVQYMQSVMQKYKV